MQEFFQIVSMQRTEAGAKYQIQINPQHAVFKGHFPDRAVVPGVMLLQIAKELVSNSLNQFVLIQKIKYIKFPTPLFPDASAALFVDIGFAADNRTCTVKIANEAGIYMQAAEMVVK